VDKASGSAQFTCRQPLTLQTKAGGKTFSQTRTEFMLWASWALSIKN
jgi:hypothetical protein